MNAVEKFDDKVLAAIVAAIEHGKESTLTFSGAVWDGYCSSSALTVREKIVFSPGFPGNATLGWCRDIVVTKCIRVKERSYDMTPFPDEITVNIVPQDGGWYAEIKLHWYSPF
jgi:hypothetical protein